MNRSHYRLMFLFLLGVASLSLAWRAPVPALPYVIINEQGKQFRTEPVHATRSLTFQLTAQTEATLSIYDSRDNLMARRVLAPQWERFAVGVGLRRWERGTYTLMVETAGQKLRFPLNVE